MADLKAICVDLRLAKSLCGEALALPEEKAIAIDGLVTAAVIRYVRCFQSTGHRVSLSKDDISGLSANELAAHDYYYNLRNKHIAHSVNEYECCYVSLDVTLKGGHLLRPVGVLPESERLIFNRANASALEQLIDSVERQLAAIFDEEREKAMRFVDQLPDEVIKRFKPHVPIEPHPSKVGWSRSKRHSGA